MHSYHHLRFSLIFQFLLTHHRYQEAGEVLNQTSSVIEGYHGDKENLIRTFYLVIQVSHLLMAGQVRIRMQPIKIVAVLLHTFPLKNLRMQNFLQLTV